MDTLLRTPATPTIPIPEGPKDNTNTSGHDDTAPIEIFEESGHDIVLESLGIEDNPNALPEADKENAKEVKQYILDIIKKSGDSPTMGVFQRTLNDIKADMGLSENAEPSVILDRIGGVLKAWKSLTFIKDSHQKKSILSRLMRANDSKDMNRIVFDEMQRFSVWR